MTSQPEPSYYSKYEELVKSGKADDEQSFIEYFQSLTENEWIELLTDLLDTPVYPVIIQRDRKDYPTIAYFSIFIDKLPRDKKDVISNLMDRIAADNLPLETKEESEIFSKLFEFSRQLEWGLSSSFLVKNVILNSNFSRALRYDAAILLSIYTDDTDSMEFWKAESKGSLQFYPFLSFPRFFFLSESDPVEAFLSLEYFQKTEYILEEEIRLPLEDFFEVVLKDSSLQATIKKYYHKISGWIKDYIESTILPISAVQMLNEDVTGGQIGKYPDANAETNSYSKQIEFESIRNFVTQKIKAGLFLVNLISSSHSRIGQAGNARDTRKTRIIPFDLGNSKEYEFIQTGIEHFNRSEFPSAFRSYRQALDLFYREPKVVDVKIYFYSELLLQLANIYFVNTDFKRANDLYKESYNIIANLDFLPKTASFDAQLKILGILSYTPELYPGWDELLEKYIENVKDRRDDSFDWSDAANLISDACYFLCNGYARSIQRDKYIKASDMCFNIAYSKRDWVGCTKIKILDYMYYEDRDILSDIIKLIASMSEDEKRDPYLTTVFGNLDSPTSGKRQKIDNVRQLFIEHKIPLQLAQSLG